MIRKLVDGLTGFLSIEGLGGVKDIYLLIAVGTFISMSVVYYFLVYRKEYHPTRFTVVRKHLLLIIIFLSLLAILFRI